jgi:hypothetical protein
MGTVPVVIDGVLNDVADKTMTKVRLTGQLSIAGLSVGGGPVIPPVTDPPATPGVPTFPIWGPPGMELPPIAGYPPVAGHPLPPTETPPDASKPPAFLPIWHPDYGWIVVPVFPVPTPSGKR